MGFFELHGFDLAAHAQGRTREVIDLLTRGWKFRPEMGDHDGPYLNMGGKPS